MRLIYTSVFAALLQGCSLFGSYAWLHPEKTQVAQVADNAECLSLASIVYGSNEDLLNLAVSGSPKPNKGVEADCLAQKGYRRVFIRNRS